jgi:hypothetical protein
VLRLRRRSIIVSDTTEDRELIELGVKWALVVERSAERLCQVWTKNILVWWSLETCRALDQML